MDPQQDLITFPRLIPPERSGSFRLTTASPFEGSYKRALNQGLPLTLPNGPGGVAIYYGMPDDSRWLGSYCAQSGGRRAAVRAHKWRFTQGSRSD